MTGGAAVKLAPITDLPTATANMKDLASPDSTLRRLVRARLHRPEEDLRPPRSGRGDDRRPLHRVGEHAEVQLGEVPDGRDVVGVSAVAAP